MKTPGSCVSKSTIHAKSVASVAPWHMSSLSSAYGKVGNRLCWPYDTNLCIRIRISRTSDIPPLRPVNTLSLFCVYLIYLFFGSILSTDNIRVHFPPPPGAMILGPVSLLDCVIFVLCLIPNLLVQAGLFQTLSLVKVIPFLGIPTSCPSCQERLSG
jgi:hypothetical protein